MRVFPDTNFLISAFVARGLSHELLELIIRQHDLVIGKFVLNELNEKLTDKLKLTVDEINHINEFLSDFELTPTAKTPINVTKDPDDNYVLASAILAKAEILITGDKDLLEISESVSDIRILSPRSFWEFLKKN